ncbi:spore coat protein CotJB [Sporanaerobium hydrogeniformans]|uniref:Spore coat protein CotJB n=1 Tax=Sporanaerobium hydrogeniformans TaxID=3072179 RepID=A0AC61DAR7_9FIRM|nr:spore coat protein CotJB [Sporanaerobium hydrogeniformans]PHV69632.1 spore coat protein CotJB [Sporanaerobium hydrogeniformans]
MSIRNQQSELLDLISSINFALFDTVLFLDTHPTDQNALAFYNQYLKLSKQAVNEYVRYFGPLTSDDVQESNEWTWVNSPWPWEMED